MMKILNSRTAARLLTMSAVAVASSGCAMKGDVRQLQDELRTMAERQDSLMAEIRAQTLQTQDTLRTQGDQMFDLRGDINRQLQLINQALTRIEAITGENQRGLSSIRDQLANMRRGAPAAGGAPTTFGPGVESSQGMTDGESLVGGGADELWGVAREQLGRGSLNTAGTAFNDFLTQYPEDPRVPQAHFYLADILEQQDRPEDALAAFQEIQALFPTHEQVPAALYRIGSLQVRLDDLEGARQTFERIINTYPDSPMAMLAREDLEEIGGR